VRQRADAQVGQTSGPCAAGRAAGACRGDAHPGGWKPPTAVAAPREPRRPDRSAESGTAGYRLAQAVAHAERDGHIFASPSPCSISTASRWSTIRSGTALVMSSSRRWRTASPVSRAAPTTVGRLGGDEFLFIMDRLAKRDDAEHIARRAVAVVAGPRSGSVG